MQTKRCPRCTESKAVEDFANNRAAKDGRQTQCRSCSALTQKEYFQRNAEAVALRYAERLARSPGNGTKECRKCGETKPLLSFYAHRTTKDRRANYCMDCQRAATRAWQKANADKVKQHRADRAASGKNPKDHRQWWLKLYRLTQADYQRLLDEQNGVCAICLQPERYVDARTGTPRRLAVDHDHTTNQVRGLLCGRCNRALGQFGDSADCLARATDYLRKAVTTASD